MKRKIEDYKKQKIAIYCSSKEEWDKIDNLFGKKGLTRDYGDISNPDNMFVDCIHINGMGTASKEWYEQKGYIVYPASDFLKENPQFEVGKWYTHDKWSPNSYIKFHSIRDYNSVNELERISQGSYKKEINWSISYEHSLKAVQLEEIQQYLPDGHVDKIKYFEYVECISSIEPENFTVGKIYHIPNLVFTSNTGFVYRKVKCIEEFYPHCFKWKISTKEAYKAQEKKLTGDNLLPNEIYVTDYPKNYIFKTSETGKGYSSYICNNNTFDLITGTEYIWSGNIRLATIEEKKWLNTCITQDKFISKEDLHLYDNSGLLIQKENMEEIVEEANGFYIPIQNGKLLSQSIKKGFRKALPNEIPITSECIMYNGEIFEIKESFKTEISDFGDIYIAPVIKKTKKLETITIESTTNLELNLTKIKSKQIKTIKI